MTLVLSIAALSACGGGGGGGPAASGGGVVYTGVTTPATVTNTNANALAGNVTGSTKTTGTVSVTGAVAASSNTPRVSRIMPLISSKVNQVTGNAVTNAGVVYGAATPVSGTSPCAVSGAVSYSGSIDNVTGAGSVSFTFSQCVEAAGTLSGGMTVTVNGYDLVNSVITDASVSFASLSFNDSVATVIMGGTFTDVLNQTTSTRTQTANFIAVDNASGKQVKLQNYQVVTVLAPNWSLPLSYTLQSSGRVFDSSYGYIDVSTTSPLLFASMTALYPYAGGPVVLTGAPPSQVTVQPASATNVLVSGVDANGNAFGPNNVLWSTL